ncbi:MAG: pyridoxal-phosphate dependent enzyme [Cyclobacteriaceae bacterium]|nr:pyridoxal-phosphate dependent enzyme [Cyclobacteriaceae bacterium HetDA_MAG_MS6]
MNEKFPSLSDIKRTHQRIQNYILHTPILTSHSISEMAGAELFFKCENFQKVGAFKMRGAANAIFSYRPEERVNGFATHSSGNHAQAVAMAAKLAETKAYVVMPKNAPKVKISAVAGYGAEIIFCEPTEEDRVRTCNEIIEKTGAVFVPPFNDPQIIAGQATAAKELIEEAPDLDFILTPVGGGGLAAGTALAVNYLVPNTQVILGEPERADDTFRSFKSGELQGVKSPDTIADGLKVSVGELNFEIIKKYVTDVVTVSEKQIVDAMRIVWERMKIVIEPSCAVPLAVVLKDKKRFSGRKVGIILTGGNVDLGNLPF